MQAHGEWLDQRTISEGESGGQFDGDSLAGDDILGESARRALELRAEVGASRQARRTFAATGVRQRGSAIPRFESAHAGAGGDDLARELVSDDGIGVIGPPASV